MISKTLLAFTLMYISTSSADGSFNLVLKRKAANDVMDVMESSNKIDSATRTILEQAALHTPVHEDWTFLRTEQECVKTTARTWRSSQRPALFAINDGILAFKEQFFAFYDYLVESAADLDNAETRSDFVAILEELNGEVLTRKAELTDTADKLAAFNHSVSVHLTIVSHNLTFLESKYDGDMGVLQNITVQIAALDAEYEKINAPVTVDPSAKWAHFRAVDENSSRILMEKQQLVRQLEELKFSLSETRKLHRTLIALADGVNETVNAVKLIATAWNNLDRDYGKVTKTIELSSEGDINVVEFLEKARDSWEELAERAREIKRNQLNAQG